MTKEKTLLVIAIGSFAAVAFILMGCATQRDFNHEVLERKNQHWEAQFLINELKQEIELLKRAQERNGKSHREIGLMHD